MLTTRRQLLQLPAAWPLFPRLAPSQTSFPGVAYRDYFDCLPGYMRELASRAYRARDVEIAKLVNPEAVRKRQAWARKAFWDLAGGMPERTPLNARTLGSIDGAGYRMEKILFESQPQFHVSANQYLPTKGQPPFPAVLLQMGHSLNGKGPDSYQRICQALAQLGYVVLAVDPAGQGERVFYPDETGIQTRFRSATAEHNQAGKQMLLVGDTAVRLHVWDAMRSLDYLTAHPLVDPKRLGATGQSGGGTLTMLLMAADDRLSVAAVCEGNHENVACAGFIPPGSTDDAEQNFPGSAPLGFDRWDLMYPFAPKPLMLLVSDKDFLDTYSPNYILNGWEEYQKLRRVYGLLGRAEALRWEDLQAHDYALDARLQIYNWFGRWLKKETKPITEEPPTSPRPERELWVSESGSVVRTFQGRTVWDLTRTRRITRTPLPLAEMLGVVPPPAGAKATLLRTIPSRGVTIEVVEIPSAPGVFLPAWLYLPVKRDAATAGVLALEPTGHNVRRGEGGLYQTMAAAGCPVCVPDLRGVGDLTPQFGRGAQRYARDHNNEDAYAWGSLILGKPLVGQRVTDILAAVACLRQHPAFQGRLVLAALEKMTVPAQFATALSRDVHGLYLAGGLLSYRSIVDTELYDHPFANFIPSVLEHTDLPEVTVSLAPRPVVLAGPVDGASRPVPVADVRSEFAGARHVVVHSGPAWDSRSLLEFAALGMQ